MGHMLRGVYPTMAGTLRQKTHRDSNIMLALLPGEPKSPGNCYCEDHRPNNSLAPNMEYFRLSLLKDDRHDHRVTRLIPNVSLLFCTQRHAVAWLRAYKDSKPDVLLAAAKYFEETPPLIPE